MVSSPPVWWEWPLVGEPVKDGEVMQLSQDLPGGGGKVGDTPSQPHPLGAPVCLPTSPLDCELLRGHAGCTLGSHHLVDVAQALQVC